MKHIHGQLLLNFGTLMWRFGGWLVFDVIPLLQVETMHAQDHLKAFYVP